MKVNDETLSETNTHAMVTGQILGKDIYLTNFVLPFQHLKTCKSEALAPNQVFTWETLREKEQIKESFA